MNPGIFSVFSLLLFTDLYRSNPSDMVFCSSRLVTMFATAEGVAYYGAMSARANELELASEKFVDFLKSQKLKLTSQRMEVLEHFLTLKVHVSADELYQELRERNPKIGFSTVYRTLKLLSDCGIAKENYFRDGFTRYENDFNRDHHDHIICTNCNEIFEFENHEIEELQCKVAKSLGFKIVDHQLEIYAECSKYPNCPNNKEKSQ